MGLRRNLLFWDDDFTRISAHCVLFCSAQGSARTHSYPTPSRTSIRMEVPRTVVYVDVSRSVLCLLHSFSYVPHQLCVEERKISGQSRCGKKCTSWRESPFGRGSRRKYGETSVPRVYVPYVPYEIAQLVPRLRKSHYYVIWRNATIRASHSQ